MDNALKDKCTKNIQSLSDEFRKITTVILNYNPPPFSLLKTFNNAATMGKLLTPGNHVHTISMELAKDLGIKLDPLNVPITTLLSHAASSSGLKDVLDLIDLQDLHKIIEASEKENLDVEALKLFHAELQGLAQKVGAAPRGADSFAVAKQYIEETLQNNEEVRKLFKGPNA